MTADAAIKRQEKVCKKLAVSQYTFAGNSVSRLRSQQESACWDSVGTTLTRGPDVLSPMPLRVPAACSPHVWAIWGGFFFSWITFMFPEEITRPFQPLGSMKLSCGAPTWKARYFHRVQFVLFSLLTVV